MTLSSPWIFLGLVCSVLSQSGSVFKSDAKIPAAAIVAGGGRTRKIINIGGDALPESTPAIIQSVNNSTQRSVDILSTIAIQGPPPPQAVHAFPAVQHQQLMRPRSTTLVTQQTLSNVNQPHTIARFAQTSQMSTVSPISSHGQVLRGQHVIRRPARPLNTTTDTHHHRHRQPPMVTRHRTQFKHAPLVVTNQLPGTPRRTSHRRVSSKPSRAIWPAGDYCIMPGRSGNCPPGFAAGNVGFAVPINFKNSEMYREGAAFKRYIEMGKIGGFEINSNNMNNFYKIALTACCKVK